VTTGRRGWTADREAFRGRHELSGGPLAEQSAQSTRALLGAPAVADVLDGVVVAAHRVTLGADLVSVTLRTSDGSFRTPVQINVLATELGRIQYKTGERLCVEETDNSGPAQIRCDELTVETTWGLSGPEAARWGVRSVLSAALVPDAGQPRYSVTTWHTKLGLSGALGLPVTDG